MDKHHYRSLWLSDIHLGTSACRAQDLLDFLNKVSADTIYLVGDIVDLQRMRTRAAFPRAHRQVIARLLQLAQGSTKLIYVPGNHDADFRRVAGQSILGAEIAMEYSHETAKGQKLLVFHGDILDDAVRRGTNLKRFGAAAYAWLIEVDVMQNKLRERLGGKFLPLSTHIKMGIKSAQEYIQRFEQTAAHYAKTRNFDGVICGHIHRPCVRAIDGILYANDGDWVEHRTAIAEDTSGNLVLLNYRPDNILSGHIGQTALRAA